MQRFFALGIAAFALSAVPAHAQQLDLMNDTIRISQDGNTVKESSSYRVMTPKHQETFGDLDRRLRGCGTGEYESLDCGGRPAVLTELLNACSANKPLITRKPKTDTWVVATFDTRTELTGSAPTVTRVLTGGPNAKLLAQVVFTCIYTANPDVNSFSATGSLVCHHVDGASTTCLNPSDGPN